MDGTTPLPLPRRRAAHKSKMSDATYEAVLWLRGLGMRVERAPGRRHLLNGERLTSHQLVARAQALGLDDARTHREFPR